MIDAERPTLLVVPTELDRADGFLDLAALGGVGLLVWWLAQEGVPIFWLVPLLVPLALWVLTGEAAGDVPFVGAVASGLRAAFGLRRAHEWLLAWWHFYRLAVWPVWKVTYARESARCIRAARSLGGRLLEAAGRARARVVRLHLADATRRRHVDVLERPTP